MLFLARHTVTLLAVTALAQPVAAQTPAGLFSEALAAIKYHSVTAWNAALQAGFMLFGAAEQPYYWLRHGLMARPPELRGNTSVISIGQPGDKVFYRFDAPPVLSIPPESAQKASFSWSADGLTLAVERLNDFPDRFSDKSAISVEFEYSGCLTSWFSKDVLAHLLTRYDDIVPERLNIVAFPVFGEQSGGDQNDDKNRQRNGFRNIDGWRVTHYKGNNTSKGEPVFGCSDQNAKPRLPVAFDALEMPDGKVVINDIDYQVSLVGTLEATERRNVPAAGLSPLDPDFQPRSNRLPALVEVPEIENGPKSTEGKGSQKQRAQKKDKKALKRHGKLPPFKHVPKPSGGQQPE